MFISIKQLLPSYCPLKVCTQLNCYCKYTVYVHILITIHFVYLVVDVSAQYDSTGTCNLTVVRPNTLTNAGGALPSGTEDVRFHCSCSRNNGSTARNTRWFDTNMNRLSTTVTNAPYHILQSSGTEATLIIPTFTESYAGTYTCGGNFVSNPQPPTANVTLTICKLIINTINYFYLVLYSLKINIVSIVIL